MRPPALPIFYATIAYTTVALCSCGTILPTPPASVYELDDGYPDPQKPASGWKASETAAGVTAAAHQCQYALRFTNYPRAVRTERLRDGLRIAGGTIAIVSGLASTSLGIWADQNSTAANVSTIVTAAFSAAGGVIALISSTVKQEAVDDYKTRRSWWDRGVLLKDKPQGTTAFLECVATVPSRPPQANLGEQQPSATPASPTPPAPSQSPE